MIFLTRFHSTERIALNPDLIERIEETPDTVITLTNGARYVVQESIAEIVEQIKLYRATLFNLALSLAKQQEPPDKETTSRLSLVRDGTTAATPGD